MQFGDLIIDSAYRDDEARVLLTQAEIDFTDDEECINLLHVDANDKDKIEAILNDAGIEFQWAD